jgi:hypothetical protein
MLFFFRAKSTMTGTYLHNFLLLPPFCSCFSPLPILRHSKWSMSSPSREIQELHAIRKVTALPSPSHHLPDPPIGFGALRPSALGSSLQARAPLAGALPWRQHRSTDGADGIQHAHPIQLSESKNYGGCQVILQRHKDKLAMDPDESLGFSQ